MTKAQHRRRQAAKAAQERGHDATHRESIARSVYEATKDATRVRLLCAALGWKEAEPIMATLEATTERVQP